MLRAVWLTSVDSSLHTTRLCRWCSLLGVVVTHTAWPPLHFPLNPSLPKHCTCTFTIVSPLPSSSHLHLTPTLTLHSPSLHPHLHLHLTFLPSPSSHTHPHIALTFTSPSSHPSYPHLHLTPTLTLHSPSLHPHLHLTFLPSPSSHTHLHFTLTFHPFVLTSTYLTALFSSLLQVWCWLGYLLVGTGDCSAGGCGRGYRRGWLRALYQTPREVLPL